ncbi:hypothetical protein AB0L64_36440 [Kribbella sp. NPDC051936]
MSMRRWVWERRISIVPVMTTTSR